MTLTELIYKWRISESKKRSALPTHFNNLRRLLEIEEPLSTGPQGEWFTFRNCASKTGDGKGWADSWRKKCIAWKYKNKKNNLDILAANDAENARAQEIATAAARLTELRKNWPTPEDPVDRMPEVVSGYPGRILPKDDNAAKELKTRTLTNLYNTRLAWLNHDRSALDEAVTDFYPWGDDFRADALDDDEIMARFFQLNQERSAE